MLRTRHIAIILSDTLQKTGLQSLLSDYFPPISIDGFHSFETFLKRNEDTFDYFFTTPEIFLLNADYFLPRRNKTVIVVNQDAENINSGNLYLSVRATQEVIIEQLQNIFASEGAYNIPENNKELSIREIDVLQLIVKGITNKEIADKLNISLNTVLTHRKNITSKLGIKTVSGLTFYAIMNGFISGEDIEL